MMTTKSKSSQINSYENRMVAILSLAGGIAALEAQTIFYIIPFIFEELRLTAGQIGALGAAALVGWAISGFVIAQISDRLNKKKPFLVAAFVGFAVFSAISGLAVSFATLFTARLLIGLMEGPVIPVKQSVVIAESSLHRVGLNMGIVQNFGAQILGTLVAPVVMVMIATHFGWRSAFFVAAVPGLLIAYLIHRYILEPRVETSTGHSKEPFGKIVKEVIANRNIQLSIGATSCCVAWFFLLLSFLPLWLTREAGLSSFAMSLAMATIGAAGAISAFVVPGFSDRFGRKSAVSLGVAAGFIAPLGTLLFSSNPGLMYATLFLGCFALGAFPLLMATVPMESVARAHRATATAMIIGVAQILGGLAGPMLGGLLADNYGLSAPFYLACGFSVGALIISLFLKETALSAANNLQINEISYE